MDAAALVDQFLTRVARWAQGRPDVVAVAVVGSRARDDAREYSDLDLVLLTSEPERYTGSEEWADELGAAGGVVSTRPWGAITERRLLLPSGLEVDVGIGDPSWAAVDPVDAGTAEVVRGGFRIVHDPSGVLAELAHTIAPVTDSAYAAAGVDTSRAERAVAGLVEVLRAIDPGRPSRAVLGSGHYANVLRIDDRTGIALSTDGVGSKVIVAEQLGRFDTVGIDCIAMNVNDVICVGAEPLAVLDYIAVEDADPEMLRQIAEGLKRGAEDAGVEIPGGELAQLPELIRGHPSPRGFDLVGSCFGTVALDAIVTGSRIEPGDAVIGLPSSGVHSNGLTLARSALPDLDERPPELGGATVGETLLEPTVIYVRAVLDLLRSEVDVRGLAHITSGGLHNLLRLEADVGYSVDRPLPRLPIFELIAERSGADESELQEVFNMGCGFCVVVPAEQADAAVELVAVRHPGAAVIGSASSDSGTVALPGIDQRPTG